VPTDLAATREALAQALGGPTASKTVSPSGVAPGGDLVYTLAYHHTGDAATLLVTDDVPVTTPIVTATGPGTVDIAGQMVTWQVAVSAGESVTLTIEATAAGTPGLVINTATFSSTVRLTKETSVLIYHSQVYLPLVYRGY
jgi:hypothetical protein